MLRSYVCVLALGLVGIALPSVAQELVSHPDTLQSLQQRWEWAAAQAKQPARSRQLQKGYWVGYSIQRWMEENSTIGNLYQQNGHFYRGPGKSLSELIYGIALPLEITSSTPAASQRQVRKEVGLFFRFDASPATLSEVKESTFSLSVDFKSLPVFWLGRAANGPSLSMIKQLYRQEKTLQLKDDLISAAGVHEGSPARRVFLAEILQGTEADAVRKQAAFWLGQADDPEALRILRQAAQTDRALEVRKHAVFALSQMESTDAEELLIELSRQSGDREVCKEAIFWLAQKASQRAVGRLQEAVRDESDTEIKKHAVFALTQLPGEQSVPFLIEIAESNSNPAVRKEAIFWLGQSEDPRAVAALTKFVRAQ